MTRRSRDLPSDPRLEAAGAWCLRLADGALSTKEMASFQAWLAKDPTNRQALEDSVGVWRALGEDSLSPTLLSLRQEAISSFESASRARWRRGAPIDRWAALAACLVLLVGGVLSWTMLAPTTYRTGLGERRTILLDDGSQLSLDAATVVKVRYSDRARRLRLIAGRAKFDVAKNQRRPFTVTANHTVVRATGTAFSVELLKGQLRVVLYEGHVAVLREAQGAPIPIAAPGSAGVQAGAGTQTFDPGEELVLSAAEPMARVATIDPARSLAWEVGQLSFEYEPLAVAAERMNRYSAETLVIGDPSAGAVQINGVFDAGDTRAFVEGVTGVFPVAVRPTNDGLEFISRR